MQNAKQIIVEKVIKTASKLMFEAVFGPSGETRTPGILLPNVCLNLQPALFRPRWPFPLLRQFLFNTLLPCLFQETLSSFGICMGLDSVY